MMRDEMRAQWLGIESRIKDLGLPLVLYETWRSVERQGHLFRRGYTKVKSLGAHTKGMAFDVICRADDGLSPWSTGTSTDRERVKHHERFRIWKAYGQLLRREFPLLRWGGTFGGKGKMIGWDAYHAEHREWATYDVYDPPSR